MHVKDLYSIIVTDKHAECRDFYVRWLDFDVVFDASWFTTAGCHLPRSSPYSTDNFKLERS